MWDVFSAGTPIFSNRDMSVQAFDNQIVKQLIIYKELEVT